MYPNYGTQYYMQDLQNMKDRIDRQLQQLQQMQQLNSPQQQTPITQNFQITPNQNINGIKYVNNKEDVKKELVFCDTIFVNKEYSSMWLKNARGETKEFTLAEVIDVDPKDAEIENLKAQIKELKEGALENAKHGDKSIDEPTKKSKSSGISNADASEK